MQCSGCLLKALISKKYRSIGLQSCIWQQDKQRDVWNNVFGHSRPKWSAACDAKKSETAPKYSRGECEIICPTAKACPKLGNASGKQHCRKGWTQMSLQWCERLITLYREQLLQVLAAKCGSTNYQIIKSTFTWLYRMKCQHVNRGWTALISTLTTDTVG